MSAFCPPPHRPYVLVASEARLAFESTFPPAKRANALLFAHSEILDFVSENLKTRTPGDMPYREGTAEEQQERHERMLSMSVEALGGFAKEALSASSGGEGGGAGTGGGESSSTLSEKAEARLGEVLDGCNCLSPFVKSPAPALRRSAYAALLSLSGASADLLGGEGGGGGGGGEGKASKMTRRKKFASLALVTPLTERDSSNFREAWVRSTCL